jgi:hypothetical protein
MDMDDRKLTQAEYARHRGVSRPAVLKAVRTGRIRLDADGRIDPVEADASWQRNTDPSRQRARSAQKPARATSTGHSDYHASRAVREAYMAKLAQLEYEAKSGKLIDAEESRRAAFEDNRRVRDLLLALPDRTAALLAGISDAAECHRLLTTEIRRACEELSDEQRA